MSRSIQTFKPLIKFLSHLQFRPLSAVSGLPQQEQLGEPPNSNSNSKPINSAQLLRVCTILYQQQNSGESRLHSTNFQLSHEFFLQVCNNFPYSWKPVYNFFHFTQTQPSFIHTSTTFNKMVDVFGKAKNIELLWSLLGEMTHRRVVNDQTFRIALKALASARELKKCVEFFHFMNAHGVLYSVDTLNKVVETLCRSKMVFEAKFIVFRLKQWIKPSGVTYKWLIIGFCEIGELIEASKIWNLMVDQGFELEMDAIEKMMETLFKTNQFEEGVQLFKSIDSGLSTYRLVIKWMCKRGKLSQAYVLFEEMLNKDNHVVDNETLAALVYGLSSKGRVHEAYKVFAGIEKPDINVYHGLMKGLLRLKRASEATQVFREMIKKGCEPIMHTYVMLLQGHLGKRGRKGPDPLVNFESIFVGGLLKVGKTLEATKFVERGMSGGVEVPRFDYNKFLHYFSTEEGVVMFEEVGKRLKEVGLVDLADIFTRYAEKMVTRDRRRRRVESSCVVRSSPGQYEMRETEKIDH